MKIQRNDSDAPCKPKASKKSKGIKKSFEKIIKNPNPSDCQEYQPKLNCPGDPLKKTHNGKSLQPRRLSSLKPPMERRKQEVIERKALKKVDYQRLETVLEEGQLSSEEALQKHTSQELSSSDTDLSVTTAKSNKSWIHSFLSELPGTPKTEDWKKTSEETQSDEIIKNELNCDTKEVSENILDLTELQPEPTPDAFSRDLSQNKRNVILSSMMEILPIFSNDKFHCSRDAINVDDYEDQEIDRSGGSISKTFQETKRDCRETKPLVVLPGVNKEGNYEGRCQETIGDLKETTDRKMCSKVLNDNNVCQQTSSHFINSLLVLTSFANEKEILNERRISDNNEETIYYANGDSETEREGKLWFTLKLGLGFIVSAFCVLLILLSIAWKSYRPPCIMDYLLETLPFVHPRRSYFQIFIHKLYLFFSGFLIDQSIKFSISNNFFKLTVF